jgi:hypothetical protein
VTGARARVIRGGDLKTGGELLVEALRLHGADQVFCVPGESYLAVLDALVDAPEIQVTACRQEGGAAIMAEAAGKLTGRPGICMVTRGPGATNASAGVHIAFQDSTPMILFIGQIARDMSERAPAAGPARWSWRCPRTCCASGWRPSPATATRRSRPTPGLAT